jgi:hypothetical protein
MKAFQTTNEIEAQIVELAKLKQHEEVDQIHLQELKEQIKSDGVLKFAIAVDKNTHIIIDGEHRFNALKMLGCKKIPVIYVDYNSPEIVVQGRKPFLNLTKKDVIVAGLGPKKLPPKTSKHMVRKKEKLIHIFILEKRVNIPLEDLR